MCLLNICLPFYSQSCFIVKVACNVQFLSVGVELSNIVFLCVTFSTYFSSSCGHSWWLQIVVTKVHMTWYDSSSTEASVSILYCFCD